MCNVGDIIKLFGNNGIDIDANDIKHFNIAEKLDKNVDNKKVILSEVPEGRGVYFVVYNDCNKLTIDKDCFIFKKEDCPSKADTTRYSTIKLTEKLKKYNNESEHNNILYIGKAEPKKGLRQRIKQYLQTGKNKHGNHTGGKAIWQFEDYGNLTLCYITEDCLQKKYNRPVCSSQIETQLLKKFKEKYGTYPLANWRK